MSDLSLKDIADSMDLAWRSQKHLVKVPASYVPPNFPHRIWNERQAIYDRLRHYHSGAFLLDKNKDETAALYPLKINVIKTFAQRLSLVLAGEVPDDATSVVKPVCDVRYRDFLINQAKKEAEKKPGAMGMKSPMPSQNGAKPNGNKPQAAEKEEDEFDRERRLEKTVQTKSDTRSETTKEVTIERPKPPQPAQPELPPEQERNPLLETIEKLCGFFEDAMSMIWEQSNARSIQMEAFNVAQWMYGAVFQLLLVDDENLLWPFKIRVHNPDVFMPIWDADDPEHLLEAWIIRVITPEESLETYGVKIEDSDAAKINNVFYVEHWKETEYRITINGMPAKGFKAEGYNKHNFGRVPIWYVPTLRDGEYWGAFSVVEKISGLAREYNARLADVGDAIFLNVNRKRWLKASTHEPVLKKTADGVPYYDMGGSGNSLSKTPPEMQFEDAPNINPSITTYYDDVWSQMIRECSLSPIVFGEDEGSQRSGMTLAFRMWPMTALTGGQRAFFSVAFNSIASTIFKMIIDNRESPLLKDIFELFEVPEFPPGIRHFITIGHQWHPQIPRDVAELIQNTLALTGGEIIDKQTARETLQVRNPELVQIRIDEEKRKESEYAQAQGAMGAGGKSPISNKDEPAKIDTGIPTNNIVLGEQEGED